METQVSFWEVCNLSIQKPFLTVIHQLPVLTCCPSASSSLCRLAGAARRLSSRRRTTRCAVRRCVAMRCQRASQQPLVASRAPQSWSDSLHLAVPVIWSQLRGRLISSRSSFRRIVQPLPHSTRLPPFRGWTWWRALPSADWVSDTFNFFGWRMAPVECCFRTRPALPPIP